MNIKKDKIISEGIRFSVIDKGKKIGQADLCLFKNKFHDRPFGLMESVFINEDCRGQGIGTKLVKELISEAKRLNCYKLIATSRYSRPKVHELYLELGFKDWGKEFRIDY
ncbi:MAG: GNAT family N-acetyltransferase [Patescibacteria group bacterium]